MNLRENDNFQYNLQKKENSIERGQDWLHDTELLSIINIVKDDIIVFLKTMLNPNAHNTLNIFFLTKVKFAGCFVGSIVTQSKEKSYKRTIQCSGEVGQCYTALYSQNFWFQ